MGREVRVDAEAAASPVRFALVKAVEGGTSGAMAMAIQVQTHLHIFRMPFSIPPAEKCHATGSFRQHYPTK